jgi:hypothetical protein
MSSVKSSVGQLRKLEVLLLENRTKLEDKKNNEKEIRSMNKREKKNEA